jgi:hypothetical protein
MTTTEPNTADRITFSAYLQPTLKSGEYQVRLEQTIAPAPQTFSSTRRFYVAGERFSLPPSAIRAVFPPDGSLGDHSNVLPHIILDRGSLPWERSPDGTAAPLTWLLLLLFDESEKPEPQIIALSDLHGGAAYMPPIEVKAPQKPSDRVTVIDVPRERLEAIIPSHDDLRYLAHLRRSQSDGGETAAVIGSRLPKPGSTSTVHLVSVEGRYHSDSQNPEKRVFDFGQTKPNDLVRLVSLASWRFACVDDKQTFAHMVRRLAQEGSDFRMPQSANGAAEAFLRQGFVPVRHMLRQGGRTVSWYRSPFITGTPADAVALPARASDSLLRYYADVGMFDVSYAAAWELGRLLALQSSAFSTTLYDWKRRRDQNHKRAAQRQDHPLQEHAIDTDLPDTVSGWRADVQILRGVPFTYLIPTEQLLPRESIRFFQLDSNWMRCLLDGAYSIGRVTQADFECDLAHPWLFPYPQVSGALIRSDVVSGYPGLLIDAFASQAGGTPLPVLRMERLSENIMLCLFAGDAQRLDIHQQPEMLHFAVELQDETTFEKSLRTSNAGDAVITGRLGRLRSLQTAELATAIARKLGVDTDEFTSGHFAIQMIESAERISFYQSSQ